ncbi:MAG: hypothetical protein GY732_05410 [Gammaproteobacteria bacterium]|nr:hypothetical protein [Gammaproteobacteria bacterium]
MHTPDKSGYAGNHNSKLRDPAISGQAWVTSVGTWVLEDDNPFPEGYTISDTWPAMV